MKEDKKNFCTLMKCVLSVLVLLFLISTESAEGNTLSLQGKEGFPYFDFKGNFKIVYINPYGGISLASIQDEANVNGLSIQEISYVNNVNSIRVKKDKTGKIWLIWEERVSEESDIYIAQLKNKRIANPINLTADQKGFNFSPRIDFSFGNDLWATWVNYFQNKYTVLIKNLTTDQIWEINPHMHSSALSPHIIIDGTGRIWLFWVGQLRNHDEILYSYFDGGGWRNPLSLNQYSDIPHITPSISLDYNGFPHVVWSAYDGDDYELYYSCWDGYEWIEEKKITNNKNIADTFPSISLLFDTIPTVTWSKYNNEKREVCLFYKSGKEWSPEISISGDESITSPPKIICSEEKIGVLWQEKTEVKTALIHFYELHDLSFPKERDINFPRIPALDFFRILELDKDKYIGFGDSITYGVLRYEDAPEEGYVPRLEDLIDENIKESEVVNRGVGGELTAEGLSRINSVINEDQARTAFLMEGTNDVKNLDISIDTAAFNLREMAETCLNFRMNVFLASIIPTRRWEGQIKERVLELNHQIQSISTTLNIYFVDQFNAFMSHPDNWELLLSDATHPNEQGYQLMAETWYDALVNALPYIEINPTSLSFEGTWGETNPPSQTFRIRNSGAWTLNYEITADKDWISISPENGDSTGEWDEINVSVDISNLTGGDYKGTVTVSADNSSNSPQILTIQLTILSPIIELDKTSLSFEGTWGETNPPPQTFRIRNSGAWTLDYEITADKDWISISPENGDSTGEWDEINVSIDISNLTEGDYEGIVTASAENAPNSPQELTVNLTIHLPPLFPPLDFHGEKKKNRSLSQLEYINVLKWGENPNNKSIEKYKIYLIEGENKILLEEFNTKTFEYWHRKVERNKVYKYGLTAFDTFERESDTVTIEVR